MLTNSCNPSATTAVDPPSQPTSTHPLADDLPYFDCLGFRISLTEIKQAHAHTFGYVCAHTCVTLASISNTESSLAIACMSQQSVSNSFRVDAPAAKIAGPASRKVNSQNR